MWSVDAGCFLHSQGEEGGPAWRSKQTSGLGSIILVLPFLGSIILVLPFLGSIIFMLPFLGSIILVLPFLGSIIFVLPFFRVYNPYAPLSRFL